MCFVVEEKCRSAFSRLYPYLCERMRILAYLYERWYLRWWALRSSVRWMVETDVEYCSCSVCGLGYAEDVYVCTCDGLASYLESDLKLCALPTSSRVRYCRGQVELEMHGIWKLRTGNTDIFVHTPRHCTVDVLCSCSFGFLCVSYSVLLNFYVECFRFFGPEIGWTESHFWLLLSVYKKFYVLMASINGMWIFKVRKTRIY